jgi:hypothetical protein
MKRKFVGIAVVLAALAVLVNVFALNSAGVTNDLSFTIANTEDAMIAITQGTDPDVGWDNTAGYAKLSLPSAGFQPNSTYFFYPAFNVVNNSVTSKNITLVTTGSVPSGVTISYVRADGTTPAGGTVPAGGTEQVGIKIDLAPGANASLGNQSLNIRVGAN